MTQFEAPASCNIRVVLYGQYYAGLSPASRQQLSYLRGHASVLRWLRRWAFAQGTVLWCSWVTGCVIKDDADYTPTVLRPKATVQIRVVA